MAEQEQELAQQEEQEQQEEEQEQEEVQEEQQEEEQEQEETAPATDWKSEARKWQKIANKNKSATAKVEQQLAEAKAENARLEAARTISEENKVPRELLEFCSNADAMSAFCEVYKALEPTVHAAARDTSSRIIKEGAKAATRDQFAAFAERALS